jgi:hypothetical protein
MYCIVTYVCMYVCMYIHTHNQPLQRLKYRKVCMHVYTHTYTCTYIHTTNLFKGSNVAKYVYINIYMCIHTYIHTTDLFKCSIFGITGPENTNRDVSMSCFRASPSSRSTAEVGCLYSHITLPGTRCKIRIQTRKMSGVIRPRRLNVQKTTASSGRPYAARVGSCCVCVCVCMYIYEDYGGRMRHAWEAVVRVFVYVCGCVCMCVRAYGCVCV